ncbi:2Fe-2S iron-sulfur cluster-binding protein [Streptomyces millisiae]|uniref:2Fe-2S iron-sulfur cluster-binding protein n=1 Tax=Streptomyces millisiae TaxID=3075542 RepID=A0ABU2LJH7_9ACTN|nr:2Fe-2S iron-sulfur cluster-binding protein [Streptomyces sp. DSM 44918]MDT0317645.1 2Fe-2S iron-sulfur cluster-binding protein [Streptomyces sp. DSM 44918]
MRIFYEGRELPARPGQSVAAALIAAGIPAWRTTRHAGRPRGLFCGIGSCHDCLATIDDTPPQRTCVVPVRDGMRVSSASVPEPPGPAAPPPGAWAGPPPTAPPGAEGAAPQASAPAPAGSRPVGGRPPSAGVAFAPQAVVVGAGPAGLGVAVTAAERGVSVVLLDAGERPGGQYWRHAADDDVRGPFAGWWRRLRAQVAAGRIDYRPGQQVWLVTREDDARFRVETTPAHDGVRPLPGPVEAAAVVLCPGGADRQLPVPGWTLPGVVAAGGAQALLKGHRTVAGRRVLVAGTGPFLLPVATGLARAGARVVGVWEANSPLRWARQARAVLPVPGKLAEAAGYAAALARHRVPYRPRTAVAEILGTDRVRAVRRAVVGRDGVPRAVPGEVEVDLVALGWGFTPALELPLQLGVATRLDVDGSLVVDVDREQRTDVPGVRRLRATIRAHRAFAAAMHRAHPVPAGWPRWLTDDTLLCRCEEVPHAAVRAAHAELGAADARTVKMLTRLGMGWCQGRVCGFAAACLTAALDGRSPDEGDARATASRPLAVPVPLAELAGEADDAAN